MTSWPIDNGTGRRMRGRKYHDRTNKIATTPTPANLQVVLISMGRRDMHSPNGTTRGYLLADTPFSAGRAAAAYILALSAGLSVASRRPSSTAGPAPPNAATSIALS